VKEPKASDYYPANFVLKDLSAKYEFIVRTNPLFLK
jgi:hypothetical protein